MSRILIVDDEKELVSVIKRYFSMLGYEVIVAYDGEEALAQVLKEPDIILLDVSMPKMNGYEVCQKIREMEDCPIVFLTAKSEIDEKVRGFSVGADDYVVKPFEMEELNARIEAHLRREKRVKDDKVKICFRDELTVDYENRTVQIKDRSIELAKKEFDVISELSLNPGRVLSREQLYVKIWGYDKNGNNETVTEHIRRIRMKFAEVTDYEYIKTVWGCGYRWNT